MWILYAVAAGATFLNLWQCSQTTLACLITSIFCCLAFFGTAGGMFKSGKIISAIYFLLLGVLNGAAAFIYLLLKIGILKW